MTDASDRVRALVVEAIHRKGLDMRGIARALNRNEAYMHQYLKKGSPRWLSEQDRPVVAALLGLDADQLKPPPRGAPPSPPAQLPTGAAPEGFDRTLMIRVIGHALSRLGHGTPEQEKIAAAIVETYDTVTGALRERQRRRVLRERREEEAERRSVEAQVDSAISQLPLGALKPRSR